MDAALDAGANFFDTADIYGADARSQSWAAGSPMSRSAATRVGAGDEAIHPPDGGPNTGGLSCAAHRKSVRGQPRSAGTDHIDLYQCHHIDRTPWEEIWKRPIAVRDGKGYLRRQQQLSPAGTSPQETAKVPSASRLP